MPDQELIPIEVISVVETKNTHTPFLLLLDKKTNRILSLAIGEPELRNIVVSMQKISTPRPLTHQLFANTLKETGLELDKIVIDEFKNNIYYATLHLIRGQYEYQIDSRPSDAIALALELKTKIYVLKEIIDKNGLKPPFKELHEQGATPQDLKKYDIGEMPGQIHLTPEDLTRLEQELKNARKREKDE